MGERGSGSNKPKEFPMTYEEAVAIIQSTRSFIGTIEPESVVLDGPFRAEELEAILFLMRNRALRPGSV